MIFNLTTAKAVIKPYKDLKGKVIQDPDFKKGKK